MIEDSERVDFTFDRIFSTAQSDTIAEIIRDDGSQAEIRHRTSHSTRGIQAADCIAGLVGEGCRGGREWIRELNGRIIDVSHEFLEQLNDELVV